MVIWFIGKSASGKTYLGEKLYLKIKSNYSNIVFLDGDKLRAAISEDLSHSEEDRYISEKRRSRLCKLLSDQGMHVICSGISNSPEIRSWNKKHIKGYLEIYLKTKKETLYNRDPKGLYNKYHKGEIKFIVGEDIEFHQPNAPWMEIDNDDNANADFFIENIFSKLMINDLIK